jgi:peptidoglycan hydrolase-like protein with peptidoglycan-binding domain
MTAPAQQPTRPRRLGLLIAVLLAAAVVAAVVVVAVRATGASGGSAAPGPAAPPGPAAAPRSSSAAPVAVSAVSPAAGSTGVATGAALTVTYSGPVAANAPAPTLSPAVAGAWARHGNALTFTPSGGWLPYATETVSVPQPAGGAAVTSSFTVQKGDELRLEQLLAELGYLPFTFVPDHQQASTALAGEATTADAVTTAAVPGSLNWAWASVPPTLTALWAPGKVNTMDQGAVMAFQSDHGMKMDGIAGPQVWSALVAAVAGRVMDKNAYDYLVASEALPETLTVYRDGQQIYSTKANTGVAGAVTAKGTFPVYSRFASTTMRGTNPDGTKYDDKGIPWVAYFNGGDAVHGFVRPSYGHPQSNGCVELPIANAAQVWTMDPYGTLVTVTG